MSINIIGSITSDGRIDTVSNCKSEWPSDTFIAGHFIYFNNLFDIEKSNQTCIAQYDSKTRNVTSLKSELRIFTEN